MAEQELIDRIAQYMPNGNKVLAGHMAKLFDDYELNGQPAANYSDHFDLDQILGDTTLNYRERKSKLIEALRETGYHSDKEMMIEASMRSREENRLLNMNEKEKREEAALAEAEETKARFNLALEKIAAGNSNILPEMSKLREFLDMALTGEYSNGCMISGPAGISKTHSVFGELKSRKIPFENYNAHASALGLYEIFYKAKKGVVVLDDLESLLEDKKAIGILKAASFSATGIREITWNSTSKVLAEHGLPTRFVFEGKIIIISNHEYRSKNESFNALLSRMPVFRLTLGLDARKLLVRSVVMTQDIFGVSADDKKKVLEYMEGLLDFSKADSYNLRTAIRAVEVYKLKGEAGKALIADLLGVDERMRKLLLIEERAAHLPVKKRVEIWKEYTGYSRSAYHDLKARYYSDKYDNAARLEKELEEIDSFVRDVENGD